MPPRATRRTQKRTNEHRVRIDIKIDGVSYRFDTSDITHRHELALWQQARLTMAEVFNALGSDKPALFMLAAIVFLARQADGETGVTFDQIAEAITYDSTIAVDIIDGDDDKAIEADATPKAPAGD